MAAGSKVGQQKGKDWDIVVPRYGYCDMEESVLEKVVAACKLACGAEHKYYKDYAQQIKGDLDKELTGSWHIIVGKLQKLLLLTAFLFEQEPTSDHLSVTNQNALLSSGSKRRVSSATNTDEVILCRKFNVKHFTLF